MKTNPAHFLTDELIRRIRAYPDAAALEIIDAALSFLRGHQIGFLTPEDHRDVATHLAGELVSHVRNTLEPLEAYAIFYKRAYWRFVKRTQRENQARYRHRGSIRNPTEGGSTGLAGHDLPRTDPVTPESVDVRRYAQEIDEFVNLALEHLPARHAEAIRRHYLGHYTGPLTEADQKELERARVDLGKRMAEEILDAMVEEPRRARRWRYRHILHLLEPKRGLLRLLPDIRLVARRN